MYYSYYHGDAMFNRLMLVLFTLVMGTSLAMVKVDHTYHYKVLVDSQLKQEEKDFIAQSRINFYRGYPYLYEGNMEEERDYVKWFFSSPKSAVAFAYDGEKIIGFITGTPLVYFDEHFKGSADSFKKAELIPEDYYYLTDVIILPEYRGNGIAKKLCRMLEEYAKQLEFRAGCFVNERHEKHPLKPAEYTDLDDIFIRSGCIKLPISVIHNWKTIMVDGNNQDQDHTLVYWHKKF
jgi:ribosomal protein S18 acetylase RimI-like enzyme